MIEVFPKEHKKEKKDLKMFSLGAELLSIVSDVHITRGYFSSG
jgi:hypothetical protein